MTKLHVFPDPQRLAQGCADFIARIANKHISETGKFNLAISGGTTPIETFRRLADAALSPKIEWKKVNFFWADERCVPPDHPDSNYGTASRELLAKVDIPSANIHRMRGELAPAEGAPAYREELNRHFGSAAIPCFDLILLGLGEDGHIASLVPGSKALEDGDELVVANYLPKLGSWRLTMTFPLINSAEQILFLVQGSSKARIVEDVLEGTVSHLPAAAVRPASGNVDWFLDIDAAGLLSRQSLGDQ